MKRGSASFRQLDAFRAFMEAGSVTRAAERMSLTQPAVSKLLAVLEHEVGYPLFNRSRRRLVPTTEATLLYRQVQRAYVSLETVAEYARELRNHDAGELTVVSTSPLALVVIPRTISRFSKEHPKARIAFQARSSHIVHQKVVDQQVDLGISMLPFEHPSGIGSDLCRVPAVCIVPSGHRLTGSDYIRADDLEGETFISFSPTGRMRHLVDAVFEQKGISRNLQFEAFASSDACAMVSQGLGVSVVDPFTASTFAPTQLTFAPLDPPIYYSFRIMRPRYTEKPLMLDAFLAMLREELTEYCNSHAIAVA